MSPRVHNLTLDVMQGIKIIGLDKTRIHPQSSIEESEKKLPAISDRARILELPLLLSGPNQQWHSLDKSMRVAD